MTKRQQEAQPGFLDSPAFNRTDYPESFKFKDCFETEKACGLIDFKFTLMSRLFSSAPEEFTLEEIFGEFNRMQAAPTIPDPDLF